MDEEIKLTKTERAELFANKFMLLLQFINDLKVDRDLIEEAANLAHGNASYLMSGSPLIDESAINPAREHLNVTIQLKRAKALLNFIEVFESTEKERELFEQKQEQLANKTP